MTTTTFDMTAVEKSTDAYLASTPAYASSIESRRAWHLLAALLRAKGATTEEQDWILKALVAGETAEFWRGWYAGYAQGEKVPA
jgi:hypothetical protein